jgi:[acyl-carrier-protein] S-malonyltransferase
VKFAFVFPGQGSQSVGMLLPFAESKAVRDVVTEASDTLKQDLWKFMAEGPVEELSSTVNTQPVMLTAGYAIYRAWREAGGAEPALVAGHSLGEYSALVVSGVLAFRDALPLVRLRAQAMQEAVPAGAGAMAACREAAQGEVVEPVNFNAPNQVVIAGHRSAVERGAAAAKAKGAKRAVMLPVSAPFHSSLLKPAADKLAAHLEKINLGAPRIPVVNNVDVAQESDPKRIKSALARQACNPVRWVEVVRAMAGAGVTHVVECGPGKVLAGLTKRIKSDLLGYAITDSQSLVQTKEALKP